MKLKSITIQLDEYGFNGRKLGDYYGTLEFVSPAGGIQLKLNSTLSQSILAIVADNLVETSKDLARNLTTACIEAERQPSLSDLQSEQSS